MDVIFQNKTPVTGTKKHIFLSKITYPILLIIILLFLVPFINATKNLIGSNALKNIHISLKNTYLDNKILFLRTSQFINTDAQAPYKVKFPVIERIKKFFNNFIDNYLEFNNLISYFVLLITSIFIFYFIKDLFSNIYICIFCSLLNMTMLYYFTCYNFTCDISQFKHIYLISPALYFINGVINRSNYYLIIPAIIICFIIFIYDSMIPLFICTFFYVIDCVHLLIDFYKNNYKFNIKIYLHHFFILLIIYFSSYLLIKIFIIKNIILL
jgi:hypothetical protein